MDININRRQVNIETEQNQTNVDVGGRAIYENDHSRLSHRTDENQHPISAITGLEEALENAGQVKDVTYNEESVVEDGVAVIPVVDSDIIVDYYSDLPTNKRQGTKAVVLNNEGSQGWRTPTQIQSNIEYTFRFVESPVKPATIPEICIMWQRNTDITRMWGFMHNEFLTNGGLVLGLDEDLNNAYLWVWDETEFAGYTLIANTWNLATNINENPTVTEVSYSSIPFPITGFTDDVFDNISEMYPFLQEYYSSFNKMGEYGYDGTTWQYLAYNIIKTDTYASNYLAGDGQYRALPVQNIRVNDEEAEHGEGYWRIEVPVQDVKVNGDSVLDAQGNANITILEVPTKTSDLINDSGFITNTVNNLANYYLKSETYTRDEVLNLISQIQTTHFEKVEALPVTGVSNVIYLVPKTAEVNNIYDEYIWIDNAWEHIGSTAMNLNDYVSVNAQVFTSEQKEQARANIGALQKDWGIANANKNIVTDANGNAILSDYALGQISVDTYDELPIGLPTGTSAYVMNDSSVYEWGTPTSLENNAELYGLKFVEAPVFPTVQENIFLSTDSGEFSVDFTSLPGVFYFSFVSYSNGKVYVYIENAVSLMGFDFQSGWNEITDFGMETMQVRFVDYEDVPFPTSSTIITYATGAVSTIIDNFLTRTATIISSGQYIYLDNVWTYYESIPITSPLYTLLSDNWLNKSQTVNVPNNDERRNTIDIILSSAREWSNCGVLCTSRTDDTLTFTCANVPNNNLYFKITSEVIKNANS